MDKIIICIFIAVIIAVSAYYLHILKKNAVILLGFFLGIVIFFGSYKLLVSVILVFSIIIFVDLLFGKRTKEKVVLINKKNGPRDCIQLAANCLLAVICVPLHKFMENEIFIIVFFSVIGEAVGDSIASDVGVLSRRKPIDICTLQPVEPGLSGGISFLGVGASVLMCAYCAVVYYILFDKSVFNAGIIFICAIFGVLADSYMGSILQAKYACPQCGKITEKRFHCGKETLLVKGVSLIDNCLVNFLSNLFSGIAAYILSSILING